VKSNKKRYERNLAALDTLTSTGKTNANFVEDFVNKELANVLDERKLKKIEMKRAIFSHLKKGLVISGPVSVPDNSARSDQSKKPLPVGFLINTMRLVDPVSRRALQPGVTLVEMRPLRGGSFAFDYIGGDGKVKMATDTHRSHHFGDRPELSGPGGAEQHFDIEVNHVIRAPTADDLLPCDTICTSYHDGTEKCHYACDDEDDLGFTISD